MTEPKFTPGPWKAHHGAYEPDYVFYGEEENCDREKRVIAEVYQRVGFRSYDVDLIAAAPEMYAALEEILVDLDTFPQVAPGVDHPEVFDLKLKLRKLLRKARGESEAEK